MDGLRFAEEYNSEEIGQQAVDQLPWGHNITLMYEIADKKERQFYIQKVKEHGWTRNIGLNYRNGANANWNLYS